jgi:DEAD/DEAH box helicase
MKKLEQEIKEKFNLNQIQEKALLNKGKNIILDAPTASGKTEAILLAIPEGKTVTWMLPTITACTFMYRRLCHDFNNLNIRVLTSTLTDERIVDEKFTTINIITCDPYMIDYMKALVMDNEHRQSTDDVLVLDEIDNYPVKVRSVLKSYLKNVKLDQVILASATLDEELKSTNNYLTISFDEIKNTIRYRAKLIEDRNLIIPILKKEYKNKKIGFICNSILEMDSIMDYVTTATGARIDDMNIIYHHSKLSLEEKDDNERRLFEGDYDILISNDLISMSVDVSLDLLFMNWSDQMNINIQRMGRLNRRCKKVSFTNLYIMKNGYYPPFINGSQADLEYNNTGLPQDEYTTDLITTKRIGNWSHNLILPSYDWEDLVQEVKTAVDNNEEILLRDVPMTLRYEEVKVVQKRKKGKKIEAERKVVTADTKTNGLQYDWYYPCSKEGGEKDILYMPWLSDVQHPKYSSSSFWLIESYNPENGIRIIRPYSGERFEYENDEEDEEEYFDENEISFKDREKFEEHIDHYSYDYSDSGLYSHCSGDIVEYTKEEINQVLHNLLTSANKFAKEYEYDFNTEMSAKHKRMYRLLDATFGKDQLNINTIYSDLIGIVRDEKNLIDYPSIEDILEVFPRFRNVFHDYYEPTGSAKLNSFWLTMPYEFKQYIIEYIDINKNINLEENLFEFHFPYSRNDDFSRNDNIESEDTWYGDYMYKEFIEKYGDLRNVPKGVPYLIKYDRWNENLNFLVDPKDIIFKSYQPNFKIKEREERHFEIKEIDHIYPNKYDIKILANRIFINEYTHDIIISELGHRINRILSDEEVFYILDRIIYFDSISIYDPENFEKSVAEMLDKAFSPCLLKVHELLWEIGNMILKVDKYCHCTFDLNKLPEKYRPLFEEDEYLCLNEDYFKNK